MKPFAAFAACLMTVAVSADWEPPADPDPSAILNEAREDAQAGRHEDALAKHLWFHRHALEHQPAQAGVRLSFALGYWHELGETYPPALEELKKARDEAAKAVAEGRALFKSFHDFAAINRQLDETVKTKDAFVALDEKNPKAAAKVYGIAEPALLEAKLYQLCGKYVDADSFETQLLVFRHGRELAEDPKFGDRHRKYAEKSFTKSTATLVALLAVNDRKAEAEEVAAEAKAEWDNAAFHAAVDEALTGKVPDPWP